MPTTASSQIGQIASMRRVHEAFQWLHLHERQIMLWQFELVSIPAPPFAERARAEWLLERFRDLGLASPHIDPAGNVLAVLPCRRPPSAVLPAEPLAGTGQLILLSAHIDTVFPATTPLDPQLEGTRLTAPGACDNGAGVAGLLALAAALTRSSVQPDCDIVFAGNVGEEGEGDLRGVRHIYEHAAWSSRILGHLVLDGAGHEVAVTGALGSKRFEVVLHGSGGHSWTDAGRPNPVTALCAAVAHMSAPRSLSLSALELASTPAHPGNGTAAKRSAWNVGTIEGGASVNSIPEQARARFDLRSTDPEHLLLLEVDLYRAVEDAVLAANSTVEAQAHRGHALRFTIDAIGRRPAATLGSDARILALLRGVDRHLNLRTDCRTASTDANLPLSLGVEALSMGAGGEGGGIHTRAEWYDARGRDLGLRRVLLLLLALAGESEDPA
ncbi:MAG TPA: M20/M25/M40 family metallo-hydrolase [Acidobacteriaceae bacterium]